MVHYCTQYIVIVLKLVVNVKVCVCVCDADQVSGVFMKIKSM